MVHGWAKWSRGPASFANLLHQIGVPLPALTAWAVTLLEIFGGLAILVGAFVVIVGAPLILDMLVAMFTVQLRYGFSSINTTGLTPSGPVFAPPGYEINLLYIAGLLALIANGAGAISVDGVREVHHRKSGRERRQPSPRALRSSGRRSPARAGRRRASSPSSAGRRG
jgi:putative oxidoreductase